MNEIEKLTQSKQDYLETIYDLSLNRKNVRSIDIANALGYSRASINKAIGALKNGGYINQKPYGTITLTEKGTETAKSIRRRHNLIRYYLIHILEIDEITAEEDACKMEHIISESTLTAIEEHSAEHQKNHHKNEIDIF